MKYHVRSFSRFTACKLLVVSKGSIQASSYGELYYRTEKKEECYAFHLQYEEISLFLQLLLVQNKLNFIASQI